jgi:DNA polymerase-3 subunit alpha
MNALYRPGPMEMIGEFIARKHGEHAIAYPDPRLAPILKETYGVIVYQEQVMRIASEVAGFTLAKADLMRRAMGKKDKALMGEMKKAFVVGAEHLGVGRGRAGEIFDLIEKFASYGFNKSHSVAYSVVAYQTAYLKARYPAEFMSANLTSEIGDTDRIVKLIDDCRKRGIRVLPPDVNQSGTSFRVVAGDIRFGLSAIKNVGESAVASIIRSRDEEGAFQNIFDFARRVDLRLVNRKTLESLVLAGAFDSLGGHRAQSFENLDRAAAFGQLAQSEAQNGQANLFDAGGPAQRRTYQYPALGEVTPWSELEKLQREKSVLGFYVSGHPLLRYEQEVAQFSTLRLGDVSGFRTGSMVRVCGIVAGVKKKIDKRNNTMAFVTLEDFTGKGECIVFSDPFQKYQSILVPDALVMVTGKGELNGDAVKIIVNDVLPMERVREKFTRSIVLSIDVNDIKEQTIVQLRQVMERNRGSIPCYFSVRDASATRMYQSTRYAVEPTEQFLGDIRRVLGPDSIRLSGDLSLKEGMKERL